jgi:ParB-like chromosome segregation protein Spo0J
VTITHIKDLTPDPANARRHTARNVGMLEKALNEVGAARSIVIDEDGTVLAGNATIDAAVQAGITRVQVVDADGETLIAVRRSGLTDEQKTKLALYDNRVAELAEWEPGVLAGIAESGVDLSGLFTDVEWADVSLATPDIEFKEYTEDVENEVKYCTCPECGHRFPA